jgi:hypothetical protein
VFVDDKKLAAFLNAAAGLVASMSPPLPVVNAVAKNGEMKATSSGSAPEAFFAELKKKKLKSFRLDELRTFLTAIGRAPTSHQYVLKYLQKQRRIKIISRGNYRVTG